MSIKNKIQANIKEAMKAGDANRRDVLRMLDSMIKNAEIKQGKRDAGLSDEDILEVIGSAVKQRRDSVKQYKQGGRKDLAEKEEVEIKILIKYLPEQISNEGLREVILETIEQSGIKSKSEFGKIMGMVMGKVKGRADGDSVRKIVEEELS